MDLYVATGEVLGPRHCSGWSLNGILQYGYCEGVLEIWNDPEWERIHLNWVQTWSLSCVVWSQGLVVSTETKLELWDSTESTCLVS